MDENKKNKKCVANTTVSKLLNPITNRLVIPSLAMTRTIAESLPADTIPNEWITIIKTYQSLGHDIKYTVKETNTSMKKTSVKTTNPSKKLKEKKNPKPDVAKFKEVKDMKEANKAKTPKETKIIDLPNAMLNKIARIANNPNLRKVNKAMKQAAPSPARTAVMKEALKIVKQMRGMKITVNDHPAQREFNWTTHSYTNTMIRTTDIIFPNGTSATISWSECGATGNICLREMTVVETNNDTLTTLKIRHVNKFMENYFELYYSSPDIRPLATAFFIYFVDHLAKDLLPKWSAQFYRGKVFKRNDIVYTLIA
jgi:hypothetical protein